MTTKNLGAEGFSWWFGVVEDREDPQKLGRVKVRIHITTALKYKHQLLTCNGRSLLCSQQVQAIKRRDCLLMD